MTAARSYGSQAASSTSASGTLNFPSSPRYKGDVVLVTAISTVSQSSLSLSGGGGTWANVVTEFNAGGLFIQAWIGWGFDVTSVATTFSWSRTGTTQIGFLARQWSFPTPMSSQPTVTSTTASGTSTSAATASITPAVDDVVTFVGYWANTTASTARTDTPGGNEGIGTGGSQGMTASRMEDGFRIATSASALSRTWTITSANWVAIAFKVTPVATNTAGTVPTSVVTSVPAGPPVAFSAYVYKGRLTATADTGSNGVV